MDEIFHKTTGYLDVVKVSLDMPHRFGKNGELLIAYENTDLKAGIRRASITSQELVMPEKANAHVEEAR